MELFLIFISTFKIAWVAVVLGWCAGRNPPSVFLKTAFS